MTMPYSVMPERVIDLKVTPETGDVSMWICNGRWRWRKREGERKNGVITRAGSAGDGLDADAVHGLFDGGVFDCYFC